MKKNLLLFFAFLFSISMVTAQVNITMTVNTETLGSNVSADGIYLAGGCCFGVPGDNPMTDNGDGTWSITVSQPVGFSSHYTFLNGNCPAWDCKENLAGLSCADPDNFNDRFLEPVSEDMTILACFGTCDDDGACTVVTDSIAITFMVNDDLLGADLSPDGLFIAGGGNFGNPGDNPLTDADGDGIWTVTIKKPVGFSSFYTFTNGNCPDYSCKEDIAGLSCGDPDNFNDRFLPAVTEDITIMACFGNCSNNGSCDDTDPNATITFMVNDESLGANVSPDGLFIAGGGNFGNPGDNPLTDDDGDGIWTATFTRPVGFSSFYTFTNGNCPDYSCKENLAGLPCGDPDNFNDRFLPEVTGDVTIMACFATCNDDGSCTIVTDSIDLTFNLNTSSISEISPEGIFLAGGCCFGVPGDNPMSDTDGDGIYTITVTRVLGFSGNYTFTNGACAADWSCKENLEGLACADAGNFNDRFIDATMESTTITACFGTCDDDGTCNSAVGINQLKIDETLFTLQPTSVKDYTTVIFGDNVVNDEKQVLVMNAVGQVVLNQNVSRTNTQQINASNFANGIYFLTVKTDKVMLTKKFVVNK